MSAANACYSRNLRVGNTSNHDWSGTPCSSTRYASPLTIAGVRSIQLDAIARRFRDGDYRIVRTSDGAEYSSYAVLLALGSTYRRLDVPGEEDFIGAGIHFCATCDGGFYRDKDVLVIGSGNSAGEESIFLTKFAKTVTIATRDDGLSASKVVIEKVQEDPKISLISAAP